MQSTLQTTSRDLFFDLGWKSTALFVVFVWWMSRGSAPLYMVDFSTFEPPEEWKVPRVCVYVCVFVSFLIVSAALTG